MLFGPAAFVMLLAAVALFAGLVALQFAASRARNAIAGLVLPIASLVAAIRLLRPELHRRRFASCSLREPFRLQFSPLPCTAFLRSSSRWCMVRQRRKMEMLRQLNKMNVQDL